MKLLTCRSKLEKAIRSTDYLTLPRAFINTSRALGDNKYAAGAQTTSLFPVTRFIFYHLQDEPR